MKSIPRMFRDEYFVLATTGPGLVSRTLAEYPGTCDQVKVLFPEDVCDRNSWYRFGAYGVDRHVGAWCTREGLVGGSGDRVGSYDYTTRNTVEETLKRGRKRSLGKLKGGSL